MRCVFVHACRFMTSMNAHTYIPSQIIGQNKQCMLLSTIWVGFVLTLSNYESTACDSLWNSGLCQYCQAAGHSVVAKCAFEEGTNPGRSQKTQYISILYILIYYISYVILHHIICTSTCHFRQICILSHVVLSHIIYHIYHCMCHISCKYRIMIRIILDIRHDTGKVTTYITQNI